MKIVYLIFVISVILQISCNQREINRNTNTVAIDTIFSEIGEEETSPNIEIIKKSLIDSMINHYDGNNRKQYIYSVQNLFDFNNMVSEFPYIDMRFLLKSIEVQKFNGYFLTSINYQDSWAGEAGNIIALYLLDSENNIITSDTIPGCHYHNGAINIVDWDNDKFEDIVFTIDWPVQSVAITAFSIHVYSLDFTNRKLYKKFYLETQYRNCHLDSTDNCMCVERSYDFSDDYKTIEIQENTYSFNKNEFEWEKPIKNKKIVGKDKYFYVLDAKGMSYIEK